MLSKILYILHFLKLYLVLFLLIFLFSCASNKDNEIEYSERSLYQIYSSALDNLISYDYEDAALQFEEVERQHPYSEWSKKAIIMSAYSSYKNRDYFHQDYVNSVKLYYQTLNHSKYLQVEAS